MHCLVSLGMNLVQLSSLAGLLLLSAFWEGPYFAVPVPENQHLTQHHGPIRNLHLPVGKTTCDTSKRRQPCWNKQKMDIEILSLTSRP